MCIIESLKREGKVRGRDSKGKDRKRKERKKKRAKIQRKDSGGDAKRGNTRTHTEHDG